MLQRAEHGENRTANGPHCHFTSTLLSKTKQTDKQPGFWSELRPCHRQLATQRETNVLGCISIESLMQLQPISKWASGEILLVKADRMTAQSCVDKRPRCRAANTTEMTRKDRVKTSYWQRDFFVCFIFARMLLWWITPWPTSEHRENQQTMFVILTD